MSDTKQEPYLLTKSPLARRFIVYILLFSSAITLMGTSLQLYLDYDKDKTNIQSAIDQIKATHLQSIVNNLWVHDNEQIDVRLQEILSLPDIQYIAISADGEETISVGTQKSTNILSQEYSLIYVFRNKEVTLGNLHVEATLENAFQRLRSRVVVILLTQGIKTFLVSLFIFFIFHLLIGRHLIRMANYSKNLVLDHLDSQLTLDRLPKNIANDELETLVNSINKMCSNIKKDIVERKKSEFALQESERKFRAMAETSPLAIYMSVGIEQKAEYINPRFIDFFGYTLNDVPTMAEWWPLAYPDDKYRKQIQEEWQKKIEIAIETKTEIEPMEVVVTCKDGSKKNISWGFVNIGEQNWAFGLNLTKQKRAQDEKMNLESRLVQAQKMEAIGILAGGIAHDFNNILAVIFGCAGMVKENAPPGSKIENYIEKVLIAANRAKVLVKQILAFSRQTKVERFSLKLQPLINEGLKMLRSSIPSTISIAQDIDPACGTVLADPTQFSQVLINLCTNAYHAMETTGGALSVALKTIVIKPNDQKMLLHLTPGEYVEFTVSDTGIGIEPDVIGKIFDRYFTTKEMGKGTGMGLAIVHGIMKENGGGITVESQLGKGTTFYVYFPVVKDEVLPEITEQEEIPRGKERVLFVDDEVILADMGREMLERLGYHVTVRYSSFEALETFEDTPDKFDLVITDQTMPEMTGADLARRMLQIRPDVPIILCTGYSNLIDEDSAKSIGIKEFALKPLTKVVIAKLIRKTLNGAI